MCTSSYPATFLKMNTPSPPSSSAMLRNNDQSISPTSVTTVDHQAFDRQCHRLEAPPACPRGSPFKKTATTSSTDDADPEVSNKDSHGQRIRRNYLNRLGFPVTSPAPSSIKPKRRKRVSFQEYVIIHILPSTPPPFQQQKQQEPQKERQQQQRFVQPCFQSEQESCHIPRADYYCRPPMPTVHCSLQQHFFLVMSAQQQACCY